MSKLNSCLAPKHSSHATIFLLDSSSSSFSLRLNVIFSNLPCCFYLEHLLQLEITSISVYVLSYSVMCVCTFSVMSNSAAPWRLLPSRLLCHGIFKARILEWVAISFLRHLPNPGIKPASLGSPALAGIFFTKRATWEATLISQILLGIWCTFLLHRVVRSKMTPNICVLLSPKIKAE